MTTNQTSTQTVLGDKYLTDWSDYVGQDEAVDALKTSARAAKIMGVPMDHHAITCGTPGIGKTTLAVLTSIELGSRAKVCSGVVKYADARMLLAGMADGDVLIWEEIHEGVASGQKNIEWALHYLHDGMLVGPRGPEPVPQVTVLGTTTDMGRLPAAVRERFTEISLRQYRDDEAVLIARRMAKSVLARALPMTSPENDIAVARAASNNPRLMRSILQQARNRYLAHDADNYNGADEGYDLGWAITRLGLTEDGLTVTDRRYLVALVEVFAANPAGQSALKEAIQEPGGLAATERRLIDKGLIVRTRSGRDLTQRGLARANELIEDLAVSLPT